MTSPSDREPWPTPPLTATVDTIYDALRDAWRRSRPIELHPDHVQTLLPCVHTPEQIEDMLAKEYERGFERGRRLRVVGAVREERRPA